MQTLFLFLEYEIVPESHWKSIHTCVKFLSALYVPGAIVRFAPDKYPCPIEAGVISYARGNPLHLTVHNHSNSLSRRKKRYMKRTLAPKRKFLRMERLIF